VGDSVGLGKTGVDPVDPIDLGADLLCSDVGSGTGDCWLIAWASCCSSRLTSGLVSSGSG
jgi:hypothetical protein